MALVSLEIHVSKEACFVHEPVAVTLVLRYDVAAMEERGVQLFARELGVPVRVEAPWADGVDGAEMRPPARASGPTIALNDEIVEAAGEPGALEIRRVFVPARAGEIVLPPAAARYATATEFRGDFVHGRVAVDREDFTATSERRVIRVRPLPAAGRPAAFDGAVGRFSVRAETAVQRSRPLQTFPLTLVIVGEGNLDGFPPPRLEPEGFHVYGRTDLGGTPRRIRYDVAAVDASVDAIPPLSLWYFDPGAGAYRAARTDAIPLEVEGPAPAAPSFPWWTLPAAAAGGLLGWLRMRRRREPDRAELAAAAFRAGGSFEGYLARLLGVPEAAVVGPDLRERLERAGVEPALAARAAALTERVVAARYGGAAPDEAEAAALVDEITASRPAAPGS